MAQQQMTNQQRITYALNRLNYIKGECHNAVHPTTIRDRLRDVIEVMEFLFAGQVSNAQPHVVAGVPVNAYEDPTKTRVEFFGGPQQQFGGPPQQRFPENIPGQPPGYPALPTRTPVTNSDVQFVPGPPPGVSTGVGGQTVQYIRADGVIVDSNGNPIGEAQPAYAQPQYPQAPPPAAPTIPGADYRGGQTVEFSGGPSRPAVAAPGAPVSNNPPQLVATVPTINTEAGNRVAPIPGHPNGGNAVMPPFGIAPPAPPGAPTNLEEARNKIPIPFADS